MQVFNAFIYLFFIYIFFLLNITKHCKTVLLLLYNALIQAHTVVLTLLTYNNVNSAVGEIHLSKQRRLCIGLL